MTGGLLGFGANLRTNFPLSALIISFKPALFTFFYLFKALGFVFSNNSRTASKPSV